MSKKLDMVSGLITDMIVGNADFSELTRVLNYSTAVIDAEKYDLDLHESYVENGIAELVKKYQLQKTI